jgi:hypothetical protein
MSSALSKRQQARNERALQDLIKNVPGNNVCADCQARNPGTAHKVPLWSNANLCIAGWASWSVGHANTDPNASRTSAAKALLLKVFNTDDLQSSVSFFACAALRCIGNLGPIFRR